MNDESKDNCYRKSNQAVFVFPKLFRFLWFFFSLSKFPPVFLSYKVLWWIDICRICLGWGGMNFSVVPHIPEIFSVFLTKWRCCQFWTFCIKKVKVEGPEATKSIPLYYVRVNGFNSEVLHPHNKEIQHLSSYHHRPSFILPGHLILFTLNSSWMTSIWTLGSILSCGFQSRKFGKLVFSQCDRSKVNIPIIFRSWWCLVYIASQALLPKIWMLCTIVLNV